MQASPPKIKRSKSFRITINGKRWSYTIVTDSVYDRKEGTDSVALTYQSERRMVFKASPLTVGTCIHELFHAYNAGFHLRSVEEFTLAQYEELIAEWAEEHLAEWQQKAKTMYDNMKKSGVS